MHAIRLITEEGAGDGLDQKRSVAEEATHDLGLDHAAVDLSREERLKLKIVAANLVYVAHRLGQGEDGVQLCPSRRRDAGPGRRTGGGGHRTEGAPYRGAAYRPDGGVYVGETAGEPTA